MRENTPFAPPFAAGQRKACFIGATRAPGRLPACLPPYLPRGGSGHRGTPGAGPGRIRAGRGEPGRWHFAPPATLFDAGFLFGCFCACPVPHSPPPPPPEGWPAAESTSPSVPRRSRQQKECKAGAPYANLCSRLKSLGWRGEGIGLPGGSV